jgi:two-component system, NtrC family, sensor histidine kinase HydH
MLPAMSLPRVSPLPVALALVAAALIATAWTTRSAVVDAFAAVRDGQALAVQQAVRADLAEYKEPPIFDLGAIIEERRDEGLRYVAILEGGHVVGESGDALGSVDPKKDRRDRRAIRRGQIHLVEIGTRIRIEVPLAMRRAWGHELGRPFSIIVEVETSYASELRDAATRTVAIGALAAVALLAIAVWLVLRELRRRAQERERERERRLASLGEMSAVLAHEIRNPLASLKGNAQLLAALLAKRPDEDDKTRAKAARVVAEAVRLETLTQDLLTFVRTGDLARASAPLATVVRDAAAAVSPDITVETTEVDVSIDAARIHQVLVNLLENAVAAGPPVHVSARRTGKRLVIEVTDNGPGVPVADREKIFEPFFTSKTRGTGLGLAIARRVVEQHRGTLTVTDAPGGGACFRIEIPET